MAVESETGFISLAELASMQTDEIKELTSRIPDAGIFVVKGTEVKATENRDPNDPNRPPLFRINTQMEVLEAKPIAKDKDPESYVGRTLREGFALWPDDFQECIGLLKGRYKTIGLSNTGNLGGVEGQEPGWLDGIVNHIFRVRVRHATGKDGVERAYFDYLLLEEEKKSEEAA